MYISRQVCVLTEPAGGVYITASGVRTPPAGGVYIPAGGAYIPASGVRTPQAGDVYMPESCLRILSRQAMYIFRQVVYV